MLRVISGKLGGMRLHTIPGKTTRPTSDRVKEAIFNLCGDLTSMIVLDLFAGTGNLGIEALSRGANRATFVDNSYKAIQTIRKNLSAVKMLENSSVIRQDAIRFLNQSPEIFDYIFADPPYDYGNLDKLCHKIPARLSTEGYFILEASQKASINIDDSGLIPTRVREFGDTKVLIFRKET